MPRFQLSHLTSYSYSAPVLLCHNVLHLCPRNSRWQRVIRRSLEITPAPVGVSCRTDFFGNSAEYFSLDQPHNRLSIQTTAEVEVTAASQPRHSIDLADLPGVFSVATVASAESVSLAKRRAFAQSISARQYLYDSPRVCCSADLRALAHEAFEAAGYKDPQKTPVHLLAMALCGHIYGTFKYHPGATDVSTPLETALRARAGVCQDFAHIFIGAARSVGIPARYVSGYRHTLPPEGMTQRLIGADATHAWVSVYTHSAENGLEEAGWFDLDPTSGQAVSDQHITLGHARDYDDLPPVRGIELGGGLSTLSVSVDMNPVSLTATSTQSQSQT